MFVVKRLAGGDSGTTPGPEAGAGLGRPRRAAIEGTRYLTTPCLRSGQSASGWPRDVPRSEERSLARNADPPREAPRAWRHGTDDGHGGPTRARAARSLEFEAEEFETLLRPSLASVQEARGGLRHDEAAARAEEPCRALRDGCGWPEGAGRDHREGPLELRVPGEHLGPALRDRDPRCEAERPHGAPEEFRAPSRTLKKGCPRAGPGFRKHQARDPTSRAEVAERGGRAVGKLRDHLGESPRMLHVGLHRARAEVAQLLGPLEDLEERRHP